MKVVSLSPYAIRSFSLGQPYSYRSRSQRGVLSEIEAVEGRPIYSPSDGLIDLGSLHLEGIGLIMLEEWGRQGLIQLSLAGKRS